MHLTELSEITGREIVVNYEHTSRRFTARLRDAEVLAEGKLALILGRGSSPAIAQREYARQIAGKRLTIDGREFTVPRHLTF